MNRQLVVECFVEDRAHEEFLVPLMERVAQEENVTLRWRLRIARGGRPRVMTAYREYQIVLEKTGAATADLMVVSIDGNCATFADARRSVRGRTRDRYAHMLVVASPDPHIERWYLADPKSFQAIVGTRPKIGPEKCLRDHYKQVLANAVRRAGHPQTRRGVEFGRELARAMDLFRAGKNVPSLKAFVGDLREGLRRVS